MNAEIARLGRLIEERADAEEELSVAEARADDLKEAGKRYRENLDVIKETVKYLSAARDNLVRALPRYHAGQLPQVFRRPDRNGFRRL